MRQRLRTAAAAALMAALGVVAGCDSPTTTTTTQTLRTRGSEVDVYLQSVADTLNDLPGALDLELLPAQPILTASTSANGKEVRAICTQNPAAPDGGFNYLRAVDGNSRFASLEVQAGDIVRYYVNLDADAAERNIEQRESIDLRVRRLDTADPENALILDGGLNGAVLEPQRIEIWRFSDKRMDAIRSMLATYVRLRRPPSGWEPSPDLAALRQIVERANLWLNNADENAGDWKLEPLLAKLPADLAGAPSVARAIAAEELQDGSFTDGEARQMVQAVWCRDIAQWARGEAVNDLDAAVALFDWTVRNVQLDRPDEAIVIHHPWQALIYGHGTATHRAWVFVELCRQQGINALMLRSAAASDDEAAASAAAPAAEPPLLVAVMLDDGNKLHLFDPALGLPLPSAESSVGTLEELIGHPELLRQLDAGPDQPYFLTAEQLGQVEALLVASPLQLARRSAVLEAALEGEQFVRLTSDVREQAETLKGRTHISSVALWMTPFQAVADEATIKISRRRLAAAEFQPFAERPLLWKARVMHFQGNKDVRAAERGDPLARAREGHQDALLLYQDPAVRLSDAKLDAEDAAKQAVWGAAKSAASYWVGLLSYDRGNYQVAASWLKERSLDREPSGKWARGARYNLARAYEAMGDVDEAITTLERGAEDDPQRHGNLVRARRLAEGRDSEVEAEAGARGDGGGE